MSVNIKLEDYIRQNISKFPFSKIETKILSLGYSKIDVQLALCNLIYPPAKHIKTITLAGIIITAVLIFSITLLKFLDLKPYTEPQKISLTASRPSAYKGEFGYALLIPSTHSYIARVEGEKEKIRIFPKDSKPAQEEYEYAKMKTIDIEIMQKTPENLKSLEMRRLELSGKLNMKKAKFKVFKADSVMDNFQVEVSAPYPLVKTIIEGNNLVYTFTAGENDEVLRFIIKNLKDAEKGGLSSGFKKLGRRTSAGFMTQREFFIPLPDSYEGISLANAYDAATEDIYFFERDREFQKVLAKADDIEKGVVYMSITPGSFLNRYDVLRYETDYKNQLNKTTARYKAEWVMLPGAPALKITHKKPKEHIEIIVFSTKELYRIWAKEENELFKNLYRYFQTRVQGPLS